MRKIKFTKNVSALSGAYCDGKVYMVAEEVADDMIRASHAFEVVEQAAAPVEDKPKKAAKSKSE